MDQKITGLTQEQADLLLKQNGLNEVPEPKFNFFKAFLSKFWGLSAWILEIALILQFILGKGQQALFIVGMLTFSALNSANQKRKSNRVLGQISHELTPTVSVLRDQTWQKIDAKYLVAGDIISLKSGDVLAADAILVDGKVSCDESSITGESLAVKKELNATCYAGTTIVSGHGFAKVSATGSKSRSGKTINLINKSAAPGHLQELLTKIIFVLCMIALALTLLILIVAAVGNLTGIRHENILELLPFLAMMFIASIPVAMPSTFAVSNSVEAKALIKQGVLTSDLTGIQDAANLNLLLIDKTGTITENKTAVASFTNFSSFEDRQILEFAGVASDQTNQSIIDQAIADYLIKQQVPVKQVSEFNPFTSSLGYSQAKYLGHDLKLGSFKQLSLIDKDANQVSNKIDFSAGRSVALLVDNKLAGIFITHDQVRPDSKAALQELASRGIKTIMLTGDNVKTAQAVASEVELPGQVISIKDFNDDTELTALSGIADVLPEDKLKMVQYFQKRGYIVGMTGDGVNDAAALKQAEVGIAVSSAADVAKRASKMVLLEDGLTSIVHILDSGHRVYQRMTAWALTKISRTAALNLLLTFGFITLGKLPINFNSMVLYSILNSLVVISIATDKTEIRKRPENWNIFNLSKIAIVICLGFVVLGAGMLVWLNAQGTSFKDLTTMTYLYLVFTALLTVPIVRTKRFMWETIPSKAVIITELADAILSIALAATGFLNIMYQISLSQIAFVIVYALVAAILIDLPYHHFIGKALK